ncbi:MAG: VWA domain-containing protein [Chloroflexi bacterium]|nr:VWA domain-containing protein [Chloroflexota bacterium]
MSPGPGQHGDLLRNLVAFGRRLQAEGLLVTPDEAVDALRALEHVDMTDRGEFYLALRAVFTSRLDDLPTFDRVFREFWRLQPGLPDLPDLDCDEEDDPTGPQTEASNDGATEISIEDWNEAESADEEEEVPGYSAEELLRTKDFSTFRPDELDEIIRLTAKLARRMATRLSRRHKFARRGDVIDLRRSMRRNIKYGGDPLELARKRRKIQKTKLVLLCDVSGSMDVYSRFLLQFIYAVQHTFANVESFVFSTQLTRVTDYFEEEDIADALHTIEREVLDWSGGTRIGQSLKTFNDLYARSMVDQRTVVLILSDGWDTGDAQLLDEQMAELSRRAATVIWLNPLKASPGYQPLCKGMSTALPYVDVFASAHNLASLLELEQYLKAS